MKKIFYLLTLFILAVILAGGCAGQKQHPAATSSGSVSTTGEQQTGEPRPEPQAATETTATTAAPATETGGAVSAPAVNPVQANRLMLQVSRDFGGTVFFAQMVEYAGNTSLLDLMKAHLPIETAYGGSFINSINGLSSSGGGLSGARQDWFNYINGICCDVGVLDYDPLNANIVWWDYHRWKNGPSISAVIGSYPEPFLHGYRGKVKPALIMVAGSEPGLAGGLQESLKSQGVAQIKVTDIDENNIANRSGPTIIVGAWGQLQQSDYLNKFNRAYSRNGTGVHFTEQGLELLDWNGKGLRSIAGSAGIIVASGEGLGDDSPLWLVAGTDRIGLQYALDLFNRPDQIKGHYGLAITAQELIVLPLQ